MFYLPFHSTALTLLDILRLPCIFTAILLLMRYVLGTVGKKWRHLPPGPVGLPVFGNIFQLGKNPHLTMTNLAKKYGKVYRLKLGSKVVIVVNGMDAVRQALVKQPMDFVSRPETITSAYICEGHSLAFAPLPGDEHKRYRKVLVDALSTYVLRKAKIVERREKDTTALQAPTLQYLVTHEVNQLSQRLVKLADKENDDQPTTRNGEQHKEPSESLSKTSSVPDEIAWTTGNILCQVLFGKRYPPGDPQIKFIIDSNNDFAKATGSSSVADMMPWVRYLVPGILNDFISVAQRMENFVGKHINEHWESFDKIYNWENRDENPVSPTNVLDGLIVKCREKADDPLYKDSHILFTVVDIMGAGFDTVSKCLTWISVYASVFQDEQEKMYLEIEAFARENDGNPSFADRRKFPYTNAFIHEVLRHASFVPLTIPHAVSRDNVQLMGYDIPRGTTVFINQWSVNHDESIWESPEHFRPERFLTIDGSFKQDLAENILLFGMGKRTCPGKQLAKMEMFLYTIEILRNCKLSMHPDHSGLPVAEFGLLMRPKTARMVVNARHDQELEG